jgi:hypothetical protein
MRPYFEVFIVRNLMLQSEFNFDIRFNIYNFLNFNNTLLMWITSIFFILFVISMSRPWTKCR